MGLSEILELFGLAIAAALVAGAIVPWVGAFLFLRRTSFYGLALPQFAAAGVAAGFAAMPWWIAHVGIGGLALQEALADTHSAMNYHLAWAALFTFGGLGALVFLGRRGGGSEVARVAAGFALASAATILFAHRSPVGEIFVDDLLRGEILAVGIHELETLCAALGITLGAFLLYQRDFLIVSYDRETARVLGKPVWAFELALALVTGLCVSAGVLTVGPVVLFGLLVLPPIAVRPFARSLGSLLALSSLFGVASCLLGIWGSFHWDLPLGPCVVLAGGAGCLPARLVRR